MFVVAREGVVTCKAHVKGLISKQMQIDEILIVATWVCAHFPRILSGIFIMALQKFKWSHTTKLVMVFPKADPLKLLLFACEFGASCRILYFIISFINMKHRL